MFFGHTGFFCRVQCFQKHESRDDIAEQLGYASAGSAGNQKYKCLERIRKQLTEINEN